MNKILLTLAICGMVTVSQSMAQSNDGADAAAGTSGGSTASFVRNRRRDSSAVPAV